MGGNFVQIKNALGPFLSYPGAPTRYLAYSAATSSNSNPMNFTVSQLPGSDNTFVYELKVATLAS